MQDDFVADIAPAIDACRIGIAKGLRNLGLDNRGHPVEQCHRADTTHAEVDGEMVIPPHPDGDGGRDHGDNGQWRQKITAIHPPRHHKLLGEYPLHAELHDEHRDSRPAHHTRGSCRRIGTSVHDYSQGNPKTRQALCQVCWATWSRLHSCRSAICCATCTTYVGSLRLPR